MRKVWLGIAGAVICLGLGLAIVGYGSSTTPDKGNLAGDNMAGHKTAGDNMAGGNMSGGNMAGGNTSGGNMSGDKMDKK
jgi:pentapeptide MXKDX repeat protein